MPSTILSDNGVTSGTSGIKTTGSNDGTLALQTTTAGGTATTALTIDTSQNVGVGTGSPAAKLAITATGDGTFNSQVVISPVSGANPAKITFNPTISSGIAGLSDGSVAFYGNGANTERMRIDSSGNVGIGTSSPGSKLYTQLSSATAYSSGVTGNGLTIYNSSATTNQYVGITLQGEPTTGNGGFATIMGTTTGSGNMDLTFSTRGSATLAERMRIDSSGNVGIGTSSPFSNASYAGLTIGGSKRGILTLNNASGSNIAQLFIDSGGNTNLLSASGVISLGVTSEAMRIDSSGNLLVGATGGSSANLVTYGSAGDIQKIFSTQASSAGYTLISMFSGATTPSAPSGTIRVNITTNGGIANYSANNTNLSDEREKKDIELAEGYLNKICAIPVKTFNFIDQNMDDDAGKNLGVIAQDVLSVASELVKESNWGTKEEPKMRLSIYQTDLQYALMKSIQELKAINDTQAETINALTARIVALEAK